MYRKIWFLEWRIFLWIVDVSDPLLVGREESLEKSGRYELNFNECSEKHCGESQRAIRTCYGKHWPI